MLHLAEAVRASTAFERKLEYLDLRANVMDSACGHAFAAALKGNCRLTELNLSGNPMDADALKAVKIAVAAVQAAWQDNEGGRQPQRDKAGYLGAVLGELMHIV